MAVSFMLAVVKSVFQGLGLAMVAPESLIEQARALRHLILRHLAGFGENAGIFYGTCHDAQIHRLRRHLAQRRRVLQSAIDDEGLVLHSAAHLAAPVSGSADLIGLILEFWQNEP